MAAPKDGPIHAYENRLDQNPESMVFSRLADSYRKRGDIQMAIDVCSQGLARHPDSITGLVILGRCYLEQEKHEEAAREFIKVIERDRRNQVALKMLADIYFRQGMREKAGDLYAYLYTMDPENPSLANAVGAVNGTGTTNIYHILGLMQPQPTEAPPQDAGDQTPQSDIFIVQEKPVESESAGGDAVEEMAQTIQMDPEELKPELPPQDGSAFARTMEMDAGELKRAAQQQYSGAEEGVGNFPEDDKVSVTGDDISARMSMMFEENNAADIGAKTPEATVEGTEEFDMEKPEEPLLSSTEAPADGMGLSETAENISGSDISSRIEQLFGESPGQQAAEQESVDGFSRMLDAATPAIEEPAVKEPILEGDDGDEKPAQTTLEAQTDVSGGDVVSRMSEIFEQPASSDEAVSYAAEEPLVSDVEAMELSPAAEVPESPETPTMGISQTVDTLHEDNISGNDIAQRLGTIFEEEDAVMPASPAVPEDSFQKLSPEPILEQAADVSEILINHEKETGIASDSEENALSDVAQELESSIEDTMAIEETEEPSTIVTAAEATVIEDTPGDESALNLNRMDSGSQTGYNPDIDADKGVSVEEPPNRAGLDNSGLLEETLPKVDEETLLDDALPAEESPAMSGDDVRTRLDEIFPESLIQEDTLSMVDEIPDGDQDNEKPNEGFYTISGEDALAPPSNKTVVEKLDDVEIEIPPLFEVPPGGSTTDDQKTEQPSLFETTPQGLTTDDQKTEQPSLFETTPQGLTTDDQKTEQPNNIGAVEVEDEVPDEDESTMPGPLTDISEDDRLNSIPDHVLTPTLADIYFQQGQPHLAVRIYSRLLQKDPDNEKIAERLERIKAYIAEHPQTELRSTPDEPPEPSRKKTSEKQASSNFVRKKSSILPKPLSGVRIKKKHKGTLARKKRRHETEQ